MTSFVTSFTNKVFELAGGTVKSVQDSIDTSTVVRTSILGLMALNTFSTVCTLNNLTPEQYLLFVPIGWASFGSLFLFNSSNKVVMTARTVFALGISAHLLLQNSCHTPNSETDLKNSKMVFAVVVSNIVGLGTGIADID